MFLITTADQRFWRTEEPVLFLGEWCKLFSKKDVWEKLSYEVLPYHWDDRKKLYQDYLYLGRLYEQILLKLSECLNQIHGVDHTVRYWRIIIGPWLSYFIQIFYDRYQSILTARESGKVTSTLIGNYRQGQWLPRDHCEFQEWAKNDYYNHYLYSRIIESSNKIPFDILGVKTNANRDIEDITSNKKFSFILKNFLKCFIKLYEKLIPHYFNQVVLITSHLNIRDLIKLQLSLRQFPSILPLKVVSPESNIDWELRKEISYEVLDNEFEKLLGKMIIEQIPSVYIEGYAKMNLSSLNAYQKRPKVICTGNAFNSNDAFKFWAAYHVDQGVKLTGVQYGGLYGTGLWISTQDHQIRIYDRFYTWGWKLDGYDNIKFLPAAKLNTIRQKVRPKADGNLLMALATMPRYSFHMYSAFIASSGTLAYFNDQYRFVRALSKKNQKLLLVRLYQHDRGWSQIERWSYELPQIKCYLGKKPMFEQLNESRLFIGTYNATTYLETFAANFPTVLFWNPEHWELRPSARPYFDELRRVCILHDTPESAARKVNEICDNPISWWQQPEIQAAKSQFCHQFARTSDNWLKEWKAELRKLLGRDR